MDWPDRYQTKFHQKTKHQLFKVLFSCYKEHLYLQAPYSSQF